MNKLAVVLSVAAVATFSGCKDPDFKRPGASIQSDVRMADTQPAPPPADTGVNKTEVKASPAPTPPVIAKKGCLCAPGTTHAEPCKCGADDCACIVKTKGAKVPASEQEYSTYVVQNGDYLAKISKKCNVTIAAIKKANDLKSDTIRIGQKLKIPGKLPESMTAAPAAAAEAQPAAAEDAAKNDAAPNFNTYVVQEGDDLTSITIRFGVSAAEIRELNNLPDDAQLKPGQVIKLPAEAQQ